MKHLLTSPLLVTAVTIAFSTLALVLNLNVITPDSLSLGAGLVTAFGLFAFLGLEPRAHRTY